jgi:DNA-binding IclR family transcriptional regulator
MKVSVSRSVGRAFAVMEVFREAQEPANASQISRRLAAPHSSVVAVLLNLRELGFLSYDEVDMTYFPTTKLLDLAAWLRPARRNEGLLGVLVDRVARDTGHMTALSSRLSLFVNTVLLREGKFSTVAPPARSVGATLTNSVHGHALLSQLDDSEVADIMRETEAWMRNAGARSTFDTASTHANIERARRQGYVSGPHPTCRGTEIIAYAVKETHAAPFALSVHIPACLSRTGKDDVRRFVETRLRECRREANHLHKALLPTQHAQAAPRPADRTQNFAARFSPGFREGMAAGHMLAGQRHAR